MNPGRDPRPGNGPGSPAETYDTIAEAFDATRERPWPFVTAFLERLPPGAGPLLDLGCGNGRHLEVAISGGRPCLGVDVSPRLLAIAHGRAPSAALVLGDARSLPLRSGTVGSIIAIAVIHHLRGEEERAGAVREMARVARPGAPLLVSVWALDDPQVARRAKARPLAGGEEADLLVPWRAPGGPPTERYFRALGLDELVVMVEGAGMRVVSARDEGANHVVEALVPGPWATPAGDGETIIYDM